jgi:hypothetical protein
VGERARQGQAKGWERAVKGWQKEGAGKFFSKKNARKQNIVFYFIRFNYSINSFL